jgi:hypothetical protein
MSNEQRYTIMGDDSGHEYFVKVGDEQLFTFWVEACEAYEEVGYEGPDFEGNRIDGRFTFTDPRNE